jgi:hypothetical protein
MFGTRAFARTAALAMIGLLAQSVPALGQFGGGSPDPMVRVGFGRGVTVPVSDAGDALKNGVNGAGFVLVNLFGSGLPSLAIRVHVRPIRLQANRGQRRRRFHEHHEPWEQPNLGRHRRNQDHLVPGPVSPYARASVGVRRGTDSERLYAEQRFAQAELDPVCARHVRGSFLSD